MFAKKTKFIFLTFNLFLRSIASSENSNFDALRSHEQLPTAEEAKTLKQLHKKRYRKNNKRFMNYWINYLKSAFKFPVFYELFDELQYNKEEYERILQKILEHDLPDLVNRVIDKKFETVTTYDAILGFVYL